MEKVFITGRGLVTPLGNGLAANEQALRDGSSGVVRVPEFVDHQLESLVGGLADENPPTTLIDRKTLRFCPPTGVMSVAAVSEALAEAGIALEEVPHLRIAVTHGAVADDNRTVMMCGKVAREAYYTVTAVVVEAHLVGHEVDLAGLRTPRAVTPQAVLPRCRQCLLPRPLRRRTRSLRRRGSGTAMRRRLRQKQTRKEPDNRYDRHDTAHASKLFLSLSHDPPGRASGAGSEADSPDRGYFTQFLYSKSPLRNSGSI